MVDSIKTFIPSYNWILLLNLFFDQKELAHTIAFARMITEFIKYRLSVAFEMLSNDNNGIFNSNFVKLN